MSVTVVIPARDAEATIGRTLAGLFAHPNVTEVIVVDDRSSDGTAAIAAELGATVLAGPGTGPSAARNLGARAATSELLAFCDADDEWIAPVPDPRVDALRSRADLDAAWGQTICVDVDGDEAAPSHLGALHGLVLRRAAFDRVGPLEESMQLGEDVDWILRARSVLLIEMVAVPCYRYQLRPGSLSAGHSRRSSGLLAAVRLAAQRAAAAQSPQPEPAPVAVVVPVADGALYLPDALRSIAGQVPPPNRIVVGDDASVDESATIAAEEGASVVTLPSRSGPNPARVAAIDASDDELVAFCDADDLWPPGRLAVMLRALEVDTEAAGVVGCVEAFASPDRDVSGFEVPIGPQPGVVIGALLIRRADLVAAGGLRTDLLTGELVALERALGALGRRLCRIDDVVLRRRVHGDNLTITRHEDVQRAYLRLAIERVQGERT